LKEQCDCLDTFYYVFYTVTALKYISVIFDFVVVFKWPNLPRRMATWKFLRGNVRHDWHLVAKEYILLAAVLTVKLATFLSDSTACQ
jgi:hypothetical protein